MATIYLIQAGAERGPIKIGIADDPLRRVAELQTGNAERLRLLWSMCCRNRETALAYEGALHGIFHEERVVGEWFRWHDDFALLLRELLQLRELFDPGTVDMDFSVGRIPGGGIAFFPRYREAGLGLIAAHVEGVSICWRCGAFGVESPLVMDVEHESRLGRPAAWLHVDRNACDRSLARGTR